MFSLFKKNNQRPLDYNGYYPPYMMDQQTNYNTSLIDTKINELSRQIYDIQKRLTIIEQYLGITNTNYPNF